MRKPQLSTGLFIKRFLEEQTETYIQAAYRQFKIEKKKTGALVGSYPSFRTYMNMAFRLGLIERSGRTETSSNPHLLQPRMYYRLTPRGRDPKSVRLWQNLRRHAYPQSYRAAQRIRHP